MADGMRHRECCVGPMAIMLISWACASTALCLAFLYIVTRPAPRMDEQMALGSEIAVVQELALGLENMKTACASAEGPLASPCRAA
jgi:hypothetical protein